MQAWIRTIFILTVGCASLGAAAAVIQNQGKLTAQLQRKAARLAAQEDFLVARAVCLNDTETSQDECRAEALDALEEEYELIDEQFAARLDVLSLIGQGPYDPEIEPEDFSANITSTFFPLVVGRTLVYEKVTPEGIEHVEVTTTNVTRLIDEIECREVRDTASFNGVVEEDTLDWYAQHANGDVWYMGELSQNFGEDGLLESLDGSWRSDVEGAKPGVLMLAAPSPGAAHRQEYFLGEAEDMSRVIGVDRTVSVPAGVFQHCLETEEWSPLEPGHFERKFWAPGVGLVLAVSGTSGAREELVAIQDL
ncbi:MAG: hypothetical protein IPK67_14450 [Planctomycetes bacterium]|nr:hypothetical protein [Planctomycetota bacterium]